MRALLCAALLAAFGCGGTSSETPWPVEPDEDPPGPGMDTRSPAPVPVDAPADGGAAEQKSPEPKKAAKPEP